MKNVLKKIGKWLSVFDALWTVPLAFIIFVGAQLLLLQTGIKFGWYDISFIVPLFLDAAVMFGITMIIRTVFWFNFRGFDRWIYRKDLEDGAHQTFSNLTSWQRFKFIMSFYCFLFLMAVIIFLKFV